MQRRAAGFTLLELLVVIGIISVLATLMLGVIIVSKYKARDTKRVADLRTIGTTLELYRIDSGHYPVAINWVSDCGPEGKNWIPDGTNYDWSTKYVEHMPRDPAQECVQSPGRAYQYRSDGNTYEVTTQLESPQPPDAGLSFDGFSFIPVVGQPILVTLSSTVSSPTGQSPIPFTITFSRSVVDFTEAALTVARGFVSSLVAVSNAVFNFFVTPTDNDIITVSINSDTVHDSSGTGNTSAQISIIYDSLKPHLALSPEPLPAVVHGSFEVTLNSTIALVDFTSSKVTVQNGAASNVHQIAPLNGRNWAFTVTPASPGAVQIEILQGEVHSQSGQGNIESNIIQTSYSP